MCERVCASLCVCRGPRSCVGMRAHVICLYGLGRWNLVAGDPNDGVRFPVEMQVVHGNDNTESEAFYCVFEMTNT